MDKRRKRIYLTWSLADMDGIHYIEAPELILGSRSDCDLVLRNAGLSGRHARLSRDDSEIYLEDLRSTVGTSLNGKILAPYRKYAIKANDLISAGNLSLKLQAEAMQPQPLPPQVGKMADAEAPDDMRLNESLAWFRQHLQGHIETIVVDPTTAEILKTAVARDLVQLGEFVNARFAEHAMLQEITRKLAGVLEIPQIMAKALSLIRSVLQAERGFIIMYHPGHDTPVSLVAQGYEGHPPTDAADFGRRLAQRSHQVRRTIFVEESMAANTSAHADTPGSLVCIPLEQGDHIFGVVCLESSSTGRFHASQTGFLEACASQIALALENVRLYTQSVTDSLTRLYNRKYMEERIAEEMVRAHRYHRHCSLLLFDIDFFKAVNDNYGHDVGDIVLRKTANQLRAAARSTDIVARYGGEEFLLLLTETELPGALSFAERLRSAIEATTIDVAGHQIKITISCGVAAYRPVFDNKVSAFIKKADQALYRAKQEGRNRVCQADSE